MKTQNAATAMLEDPMERNEGIGYYQALPHRAVVEGYNSLRRCRALGRSVHFVDLLRLCQCSLEPLELALLNGSHRLDLAAVEYLRAQPGNELH